MDIGSITWTVEADTSRLDSARSDMDRVGDEAKKTGKNSRDMGNNIQKAGSQSKRATDKMRKGFTESSAAATTLKRAALGVFTAISAGAAIRGALGTIATFEQSMARVNAITRATDTEMVALTETARELGATTEFTAGQAADALTFLGMAGFSAAESIKAVPVALDLATASGMELSRTADIMSNIMSAFAIEAGNAASAADVLAAIASRANTDVEQLGTAMSFAGPVAQAMGVSVGDAAAAIGVLSDAGIQGSMAGTGLRRVMSSLANPTKEAADVLKSLGIAIDSVNPATNDLVDIIEV